MHEKKYVVLCRQRIGKILIAFIMAIGLATAFNGSIKPVYADNTPTSMGDVAGHYANAGGKWANTDSSDSSYDAHAIKPWQKTYSVWNFFGPGKNSILSRESSSQKGGTYAALKANVPDKVSKPVENAAKFSYAMSQSGLDHPTVGGTDFIHKIGRFIVGLSSMAMMYISYLGSQILHIIFKLFKWVNPFYAMRYLVVNDKLSNSVFSGLISVIRPIYQAFAKITIGILLISLLGGITMSFTGFRQQGHQEGLGTNIAMKVLKKVFQITSIFIMPVVLGIVSAELTDFMDNSMDVTSNVTLTEIYGNFVNFSDWATHSRLALPNQTSMGRPLNKTDQLVSTGNNAFSEDYINAINAYGAGMSVPAKLMGEHKTTMSDVNSTANFLWRYIGGAGMSGEDWNGTFQARLRKRIRGIKGSTIKQQQSSGSKAQNPSISKQDALTNPYQAISSDVFGDYGNSDYANAMNCMFFSDGSLDSYTGKDGGTYYKSNAPAKADKSDVAAIGSSKEAGLSSIGLYNYLNTDGSSGSQLKYTMPKDLHLGGFNEHANEGFIGRGLMAMGSFFKMLSIIATSGLIVAFIGMLVIQGILRNVPYILVYAAKVVTGHVDALLSVVKELVDLYARVFIGSFIVYLFQGIIPLICTKIEGLLMGAMPASNLYLGGLNLLPFANISSGTLGIVRMAEAVVIFFIMRAIIRSYRDILKFITGLIDKIIQQLKKTRLGGMALPATPNAANPGFNNMNNTNANNNAPFSNNNSGNTDGKDDDDTPDSADDLKNRQRDPEQNYGQSSNSKGFARQSAALGLDMMDALDSSPAGQALKKGAAAVGGAIGGTKFGEKLHMKDRGQGLEAVDQFESKMRQNMAMAADPVHANNTARAGMSAAQRKANDAQEKHARQMASPSALQQAKADQQKQKDAKKALLDQFKAGGVDESGRPISELKDAAAVNDVMDALGAQDALSPDAKAANKKMHDLADKQYSNAQKRTEKLEDKVKDAEAAFAEDPSDSNAQALAKAKNDLNKASVISDPKKRAMFEHANRRAVTPNGVGLKAASASQMKQAKNRQFVAQTGMDASTAMDATSQQIEQAQNAATGAQQILMQSGISPAMREKATQDLHDANVVLSTGKQYGSFATQQAISNLKQASSGAISAAQQYQQVDQATVATGVVATGNAPKLQPAQLAYAKKVDLARRVIETGQVMSQGQPQVASAQDLARAQQTLASDPTKQVNRIQAQMLSTTSTVMQQARGYGAQVVSGMQNAGPAEIAHQRAQAELEYLQKPEIQTKLRETGLVNTNNPQALRKQIVRVQKMDQEVRQGLSNSLAPLRAQIKNMPSEPSRSAIQHAGEQQFAKLYASSRLVDQAHYKSTTNRQVEMATQQLLNAYDSKDMDRIKVARAKAAAIGMANPIINSQQKLQATAAQMREQRNNIISNATSNGSLSDVLGDIADQIGGFGEAKGAN